MAATGDGEDDWVVLECMDPTLLETSPAITPLSETSISTADISSWDTPAILSHQIVKVNINRSRLIGESTYFRTLLAGNFSESSMGSISVYWSLESFLHLSRFINGFEMEVTLRGFLPLLQAALYFGLERLVLKCKIWFADVIFKEELSLQQLRLGDLIQFRDFALEHAVDWLVEQCTSCVARNFIWAMSCGTFVDLSYDFIISCVNHPDLTVYSERHLCEALLEWVSANVEPVETSCTRDVWIDMYNHMSMNTDAWTTMLEEGRLVCPSIIADRFGFRESSLLSSVIVDLRLDDCILYVLTFCHSGLSWVWSLILRNNLMTGLVPLCRCRSDPYRMTNSNSALMFTGKCRCQYFSSFAKHGVSNSSGLLKRMSKSSNYMDVADDLSNVRVRLTEYLKKLDLSGCPQITEIVLLLSLLRQSDVPSLLNVIRTTNIDFDYQNWFSLLPVVSFEAMADVDISKCSQLHLDTVMDCFKKSFPLLRTITMAYFLNFETKNFCNMMENSVVSEVDLTVDVSPLVSSNVSISYTEAVSRRPKKGHLDMSSCRRPRPRLSHMSKLTLEGRTDFSDTELLDIAECCDSLFYLNIRGCSSVTDTGIANMIIKCRKLHSIIATDTSFGRSSISALCSRAMGSAYSPLKEVDKHLEFSGINLQMLHIGGCKGVCETSLVGLLSRGHLLKNLCLRDTYLSDQALYSFPGSFLEVFDVSNTMISNDALLHIIIKNPGLKYFEARGCRKLCLHGKNSEDNSSSHYPCERLFSMLGKECRLEKLAIGWGFSDLMISAIGPGLTSLKSLTVGLGGTLGPEGLNQLCTLCPLLESVSISFQVISDIAIMQLMGTMRNLRSLSVFYCIGEISPLALSCSAPHLRKLKLERVTPWMANDNLSLLAQNCANLIELSLVGCSGLDVGAQLIISSGWPGLSSLHLEDCGAVTANGVAALFDCKAMEDLLLRHNGCGIQKNFIIHAASKLPMLRSLSLDWCDASEGELDLPNFADRYSLSSVKISRCKLRKCSLDFHNIKAQERPVHKESLVLVWNSTSLQRTVVKERIT